VTTARAAIVTISARAYDWRPPAWTSFFGSSGGEQHRQNGHDDQHREQRTQQQAGTAPQVQQVVERGPQSEAEDDRDDAHL
jgi:hypothetical protein